VPAGDADGSYQVSWDASPTAGATYVLEEARDGDFSVGLRKVYRGKGTSVNLAGRSLGTYFYRVKATKQDYRPSSYSAGANGCAVPGTSTVAMPLSLVVPAADPDGSYTVSWDFSLTDGATYVLEEATTPDFTGNLRVAYAGAVTSANIAGRAQDTTYYYRVKAVKVGMKDSPWQTAGAGCAVPGDLPVEKPASITVPARDADGKFTVSWGGSATVAADLVYILEEATNPTFSKGKKVVYVGPALQAAIKGRALNKTYYYRVKAIKAGYTDSLFQAGSRGCAVPGLTKVASPASILVPAASNPDGSYAISWGKSATTGVKYLLEEATNAAFTEGLNSVYFGTALKTDIFERTPGMTYYYRVKAVKAGLKDSNTKTALTGCLVQGPL
jgi:hypothetical protein